MNKNVDLSAEKQIKKKRTKWKFTLDIEKYNIQSKKFTGWA